VKDQTARVTRRLSTREASHVVSDVSPVVTVSHCRGWVSGDLLQKAAVLLVERHPLLRGRLDSDQGGYLIRVADEWTPAVEVFQGGQDAFLRAINATLPRSRSLVRVSLIRARAASAVVLTIDHTISDGRSALAALSQLWRHYAALARGAVVSDTISTSVPEPLEARLAGQFSPLELSGFRAHECIFEQDQPVSLPSTTHARRDKSLPSPRGRVQRIAFDSATTAAFVATARRHQMTVNSLLTGAVLIALRAHLSPSAGPVDLICQTPVDLRPRLFPEAAADSMVNYVAKRGAW